MNNIQATLQKLESMRLRGMARAYRATMETGVKRSFTPDELVSHLVDVEWDDRHDRTLSRLIKAARFRYQATFEEIDLEASRNIEKQLLLRLSDRRWIESHQNVLMTGPTGVGKSFIASALGHQACMHGFRTGYYPCSTLFKELKLARADGTYLKALARMHKQDLFVLDDFGLEPFDAQSRMSLLEILEDRIGRRSTIIVSQIPVTSWHEIIGDPTIADAVCDRIVHSSHRIELKGESMRKKHNPGRNAMTRTSFAGNPLLRTDERHDSASRANARENVHSYRAVTAFSQGQWCLDTPEEQVKSRPSVPMKEVTRTDT